MAIIRRIIFIIVLLGLAFIFYRFLNPQGADRLIAKLRGTQVVSNISDIKDQIFTGNDLSGEINTGIISTGIIQTGAQTSGETIGVVDNMSGFSEIIDPEVSKKSIKGDLNYKNSDYKFSITFPGSWNGYTIEIFTGKDIKSQFVFSLDSKDYFILYVVANDYYKAQKSSELSYLTYLSEDSDNTFAYKILENSDSKSKAIPYILRTFRSTSPTSTSIIPTTIIPTTIKPTTPKKPNYSDGNYLKNIFDSFVK